ncbi:MAG: hypothetical protein JW750_10465 [Anaerolineaceae bacterium]|nr:hypothetical protein [Anaerolineaceae bacterium]
MMVNPQIFKFKNKKAKFILSLFISAYGDLLKKLTRQISKHGDQTMSKNRIVNYIVLSWKELSITGLPPDDLAVIKMKTPRNDLSRGVLY